MNAATLNSMNAIDIISRSIAIHPTTFLESLQSRGWEDSKYAATRDNPAIKKSVLASFEATMRACDYVKLEQAEKFVSDIGAGIVALNVACRLQCLPAHIRTQSALKTWPD